MTIIEQYHCHDDVNHLPRGTPYLVNGYIYIRNFPFVRIIIGHCAIENADAMMRQWILEKQWKAESHE